MQSTISPTGSSFTPKQIPFKQIKPIKYMGISSSLPFNSLIPDSKLIYFSGRSIILENIKTYEQKPIWTNQFDQEPMVIEHILNIHRQNIVGIAIRDESRSHLIIIMNINSQINNYEHLNKREKDRLHYLKNVPGDETTIERLRFLSEGALFAVVIRDIQHQTYQSKQICVHNSMSGDLLYRCQFTSATPLIEGLQLNRQNYICIIKNQPESNFTDSFLQSKKLFSSSKPLPSSNPTSQSCSFKITLIDSSQLSSKNDFLIELQPGESIMELKFFENHKKTFAFLLLNSGFVLIYMINERGFYDVCRVDARIDKAKHEKRIMQDREKAGKSDKVEDHNHNQTEDHEEREREQMTIHETNSSISSDNDLPDVPINSPQSANPNNLKVPILKQLQTTTLEPPSAPQYFYPTCISCANCKIAIGYEECSFIGLITYSAVDHREYKFRYIFDFFGGRPQIQAIRNITFSEDGCHCSVLVKVDPYKNEMFRRKTKNFDNTFEENNEGEKAIENKFSNDWLRSAKKQGTIALTKKILLQSMNQTFSHYSWKNPPEQSLTKKGKRAKILFRSHSTTPQHSELNQDHMCQEQSDNQREHFTLMHIDFISGMIEHEYHSQSIEQSITTTSLKGTVELTEFNKMNNTMLILMSDNRLYYYSVNPTSLNEKEFKNGSPRNVPPLRKKLESNSLFSPKSINNYLPPSSIQLWVDKLKLKPFLILSHPFMFQLVLILQDNLKFHFYNYDKLFECHHVLNLKNCKAACYSPFGDKLVLGTVGSIWLVDSYTHAMIKKISLVIFPSELKSFSKPNRLSGEKSSGITGRRSQSVFMSLSSKTVSRIQYINNDDLIIQTGNTTLSMLLNYEKVIFFGATLEAIQAELFSYDTKHRLGIIASQTSVKVITKCTINSKNKCEELARIDLTVTAIKLCGEIDILFLGGANGVLYFIRWPEFFQNDTLKTPNISNKLHLFHCPIVDIQISINYRQLYVMSSEGMMVICELVHSDEIQKIGKDVSLRMAKKMDFSLPLMNKWLISSSDEEKRAQNFTKLMGNEAEFKNNELLLTEEYKNKLQQFLQTQKQELDQQLKIQIRQYEEKSGISKLQMEIVLLKDEIKRVVGKRELESKQINEGINEELHKVFLEREKLQKELKEITQKTTKQKTDFCQQIDQSLREYTSATNWQLKSDKNNLLEQQKMFQNKMKIDQALKQNVIEDFMDEQFDVQKIYTQELQELYLKSNELTSSNRNKKVEITLITDKMREMSTRMFEIQNDSHDLMRENEKVTACKKTLSQQIVQTDKKYHALIKKTKEIQITLNKTRTSSQVCQLKFDDLEKEIGLLQETWRYLEERREEAESDFVEQFKLRNHNQSQTDQLKLKLQKLKAKRKQTFQTNILLKDLMKPYENQLAQLNLDPYDSPEYVSSLNSSQIEFKKQKTNKLTSNVHKWNNIKNDNKRKFIQYINKLQEEHNKLGFRFNQLQKEFKELQAIQIHLKKKITIQKHKDMNNSAAKWEKFSFVPKKDQQETNQRRSIPSLSIHRQSATKNQFNTTSHQFTATKSLHRDNHAGKSIDDMKTSGSFLKTFFRQSQHDPKLSKKGSKNLQTLLQEKRQLFKERNENGHSLYHGVTLDKQTLKPKKTMCLSLHQNGEDNGKFVTQY